jgi:hypothetical protein
VLAVLAGYRRGARLEALADWLPIEFLLIRFPWPGHSTGIHDQFRKEPIAIEELPPWVEAGLLWDCDEWNLEHACSKAPESDTESSGDESSGAPGAMMQILCLASWWRSATNSAHWLRLRVSDWQYEEVVTHWRDSVFHTITSMVLQNLVSQLAFARCMGC